MVSVASVEVTSFNGWSFNRFVPLTSNTLLSFLMNFVSMSSEPWRCRWVGWVKDKTIYMYSRCVCRVTWLLRGIMWCCQPTKDSSVSNDNAHVESIITWIEVVYWPLTFLLRECESGGELGHITNWTFNESQQSVTWQCKHVMECPDQFAKGPKNIQLAIM